MLDQSPLTLPAASPSTTTPQAELDALFRDDPEFQATVANIEEHLHCVEATTLASRYEIGLAVKSVQERADYGDRGVECIARTLGIKYRTLAAHAQVVRVWPDRAEFERLTLSTRPGQRPLDWSHMVELAGSPEDQREGLILRALKEGLSVKQLREAKSRLPSRKGPAASDGKRSPDGIVRDATNAKLEADHVGSKQPTSGTDSDDTGELVELSNSLRDAARTLEECRNIRLPDSCVLAVKRLRKATAALQKRLSSLERARAETS